MIHSNGFRLFSHLVIGCTVLLTDAAHAATPPPISLQTALHTPACVKNIPAQGANPLVAKALYVDSSSTCGEVTISISDVPNFTESSPLMPVVVGAGGTLTLVDPGAGANMSLYASSFLVTNGGTLQAGSATAPVLGQIDILMAGQESAALAPKASGSSPIVTVSNNKPNFRDITVMNGGVLNLYGGKGLSATPNGTANDPATNPDFINTLTGTNSWTYLSAPAGPAFYDDAENVSAPVPKTAPATTLTLAREVDWQPGDWISVATTGFVSHQTEIVQICSIAPVANPDTSLSGLPAQVSQLTLYDGSNCSSTSATPLKHYHYGGLAPTPGFFAADTTEVVVTGGNAIDVSNQAMSYYDDHTRNFGIDERAEVALLSRNIRLSSVASSDQLGGHLAVMYGDDASTVNLVGVEIEKFGQPFVGRYPVHLHHLHDGGSGILMQDVSVHHSYNKCYAVHETGSADFYNAVCVRTVGQGFYLEDGANIVGNQFIRNHVAGTMAAATKYTYPTTDGSTYWDGDYLQASHADANWYTTSGIADTSFSGANTDCGGSCPNPGPDSYHPGGFWITNIHNTFVNNSVAGCQAQGRGYWLLMQGTQPATAYPEFTGNRAHACYNGLDTAPDSINNASNPYPSFATPTYAVTGASDPGIVIGSSVPFPATGVSTVIIAGASNVQSGHWPVSNIVDNGSSSSSSFVISNATIIGSYAGGGTWQLPALPVGTITKAESADVVLALPPPFAAAVPANGAQVKLTGTGTGLDGMEWTVSAASGGSSPGFALAGTAAASGTFPTTSGQWQSAALNPITASSPQPIVITSATLPANGAQVTLTNVGGNTAANGTWTVTSPATAGSRTTFSLDGSAATGPYTSGTGTWQLTPQPPVLLLNGNTITRSRNRGFWGRSIFLELHNNRFAANPYGVSLAGGGGPEGNFVGYWDLAHRNVFAGMTRNNVERYPSGCTYQITGVSPPLTPDATVVITTTGAVPPNGSTVIISGVQGYSRAMGSYTVTTPASGGAANSFSLNGNSSNGSYTGGGVAQNALMMQAECTDVALAGTTPGWGNYPNPFAGSVMNLQGYSYYDGPARIESNRFVNFRFDPTGIHPDTPEARLLTATDIGLIATFATQGQLHGATTPAGYNGYPGDPATGWIQSNAQTVPPTQYIKNSLWDNVDFRHQVYTEAVNLGAFNDGDKTTVILDMDGALSGLQVVDANGSADPDFVPVSLNSIDYYATDFSLDEPHARGPNDFRETSLMSPHKYATLNIESVKNPASTFRVKISRDMPAYVDSEYPYLFLNGRGGKPIYEPFVMDRMGYTVRGLTGTEHVPSLQAPASFMQRLLFSYTDPAVKKAGEFFINRVAVAQPLDAATNVKIYRIRRQWGQPYLNQWPPGYQPPGPSAFTCDSTFFSNQVDPAPEDRWQDCLARGLNQAPPMPYAGAPSVYSGGSMLTQATSWTEFEKPFKDLMSGAASVQDVQDFITRQTYFYDSSNNLLYFYMIEDAPVMNLDTPFGTCGGGTSGYAANVAQIHSVKTFSNLSDVQAALDAACGSVAGTPVPTDLVNCGANGCVSYLVDLSAAQIQAPATPAPTAITSGSDASPIVITSSGTAPATGSFVSISGVAGNTNANGVWQVTKISSSSFSLVNSQGNGTGTGGTWLPFGARPISRSDYASLNQYHFVYATPTQQPNGLPVPTSGSGAPPANGSSLQVPHPETGNVVTYTFLTVPGPLVQVTEDFPYNCLSTQVWAPINPRGTYPPTGGFTYPLKSLPCTDP